MNRSDKFIMCLLVLISLILVNLPVFAHAATMENYCVIPPYVKRDVSVNIMILLDNSIDMLGPAHTDATYCPSHPENCWDSTNNKYYKEYLGHFPPNACYTPPGSKFKYAGHNVNYTANPDTGCPAGEFNGNVLNWATMSRYTIAKKVLTGEASTAINQPFEIEGRESIWASLSPPATPRNSAGCRWTITSSASDVLSLTVSDQGVAHPCYYPTGGPWSVKIDPTPGIEVRTGLLQEFTDVNPTDLNFDKGSPRFGVTRFSQIGVTIDQTIPPGNYEAFINAVKTMNTRANNDLATAHFTDVAYFSSPPNASVDPYKGCAVWESPPCVQGTAVPCRKSFVLMLTTGTDVTGTTVASLPGECSSSETRPLVRNACYAYNTDLRTSVDLVGKQNISTYVVQTFGTGTTNCATATGNIKALCDTAVQGGGNYYSAGTDNLVDVLRQALQDIIKRSAAGTAASVLASGEGSGANLVQAVFYPRKKFYNSTTGVYDEIAWIGRLTNLWFYVDPYFTNSNIREDTTHDYILNLTNDYITQLYYDTSVEVTKAKRWHDTDGDGDADGSQLSPDIEFEKLGSLWEAGLELWKRDAPRIIYTTTTGIPPLSNFSTANAGTLQAYLQATDTNEAQAIIRYIHGEDNPVVSGTTYSYRSRTVAVDLNGDGDTLDAGESAKVWKLGDVLNSTPKISSWIQLNNYDKIYSDSTYKEFLNSSAYTGRGMIFAGANDGMLHAFHLGKLELSGTWKDTATKKAKLSDPSSIGLGKEIWAFIPKNALPYLKYSTNPDYCHIYTVDLTPFIFDASINGNADADKTVSSWRTILIGGMRFGGACRNAGSACTNCVKTPVTDLGYSSYFALDVTDQNNPLLLWEFSNENLGFTTTGPAVVRIGDKDKNGNWFVVFGSGPTGPTTGSTDYQFLGRSDQNLRLFILDLKGPSSGTWTSGTNYWVKDTGISNAFAGSMLNATNDTDLDYQDDAVYIPYVKQDPSAGTWTQGGVGRLLTGENPTPSNWEWSKVIDNIGPVTSSVARLQKQSKGILWLFFGTGRYYFELLSTVDDQDGQRKLFGIKDSCFSSSGFATSCPSAISGTAGLTNVDNIADAEAIADPDASDFKGWYINLDSSAGVYRAERVITDPLASLTGSVFFTTYKPYNDVCALGGKSFIWAVKYNTGGASGASLKGVALLQVSTGSIEQINLSTALTEKGGRRTSAMEGVPPTAQGLSLLSQPPPVKRAIHVKER